MPEVARVPSAEYAMRYLQMAVTIPLFVDVRFVLFVFYMSDKIVCIMIEDLDVHFIL